MDIEWDGEPHEQSNRQQGSVTDLEHRPRLGVVHPRPCPRGTGHGRAKDFHYPSSEGSDSTRGALTIPSEIELFDGNPEKKLMKPYSDWKS